MASTSSSSSFGEAQVWEAQLAVLRDEGGGHAETPEQDAVLVRVEKGAGGLFGQVRGGSGSLRVGWEASVG